jgi:hypothetical protein
MKTRKGESNETTWAVGEWVEATGNPNQGLCSDAYIHWYSDPLLAVLLNPIHANIPNPRLWEVETSGDERTDGVLKGGSRCVRLIREISIPRITTEQRIRFAILCAKRVYDDVEWNKWADDWLSGQNRTAADAAYDAAYSAAYTAADAAARAAAEIDLSAIARQAVGVG